MVSIDTPEHLVWRVFVRDVADLRPWTGVDVPPLVPCVPTRECLPPAARSEATAQWGSWWQRELARHGRGERGYAQPEAALGDGQELEDLFLTYRLDALRWASARKCEDTAPLRRGREGDVVRTVEGEIGRKARPFLLTVTELPVAGPFGLRASPRHVVVSRTLRDAPAAYERWLTPVIRELA